MKIVPHWKRILRHAWSTRLIVLAGALSGVEVALPFVDDRLPRGVFALLSMIVTAGAFIARIIAQKEFRDGA